MLPMNIHRVRLCSNPITLPVGGYPCLEGELGCTVNHCDRAFLLQSIIE